MPVDLSARMLDTAPIPRPATWLMLTGERAALRLLRLRACPPAGPVACRAIV